MGGRADLLVLVFCLDRPKYFTWVSTTLGYKTYLTFSRSLFGVKRGGEGGAIKKENEERGTDKMLRQRETLHLANSTKYLTLRTSLQ